MEDKLFMIYVLSNDHIILGVVIPEERDVESGPYIYLDKPVRLMMTAEGFAFMPWVPYAKNDILIPVNRQHIISAFLASHPIAEAYYNQVHCKIDLPPEQGLVLPGQ